METTTEKKIYKEIENLKTQTNILKKMVLMSFHDNEGEYKEEFIKKILKKTKKKPEFEFTNKKDFLKQIS